MKTERMEGCVRVCDDGECLSGVVEGGMDALDEWCENILEHGQGLWEEGKQGLFDEVCVRVPLVRRIELMWS